MSGFMSRFLHRGWLGLTLAAFGGPAMAAASAAALPASPAAESSVVSAARPLERADLEAWLDGLIPPTLARDDIAGAVVTVVKDGQVLLQNGYGYADVEKRVPVDPETTLFRPGSVSKLFTWTAVMQLVGAGKLDLDADVNQYLDFKLPDRPDGPVTLRHILTHTAGFEEQIKQLIVDDPKFLRPLGDYARDAAPTRIYKTGSTPAYSNYATALAGRVVERASGLSFDDYVERNIFAPLGMRHATFRQPLPKELAPLMSQGYRVASGKPEHFEIVVPAPAGSLAASGADMARFMLGQLAARQGEGNALLPSATARQMHETRAATGVGPLNRMLLGFYETNYNGRRVIAHGGDTQFFHSYLHLLIDDNVGIFVSVNSAGTRGSQLRSVLFEGFMDRYFPAMAPTPRTPIAPEVAREHAKMVAGYYENSRRADTSFLRLLSLIGPVKLTANADGTITFGLLPGPNGKPRTYHEIAPFVWQDPVSRWRLAADVVDGQVTRFSIEEAAFAMVMDRFPAARSPAWLQPAVVVSLAAVLGTVFLWPLAAWSRRRHGVKLPLDGAALQAHRVSRWAALALAVPTVAWLAFILVAAGGMNLLDGGADGFVIAIQCLSIVGYLGGTAALLWSAYQGWQLRRPWVARLWTTLLALAGLVLLWVAIQYNLMNFQLRY
ncbi:MAG: serine hydrolase domain-containing protein [Gammaproteobacteria bacterium]